MTDKIQPAQASQGIVTQTCDVTQNEELQFQVVPGQVYIVSVLGAVGAANVAWKYDDVEVVAPLAFLDADDAALVTTSAANRGFTLIAPSNRIVAIVTSWATTFRIRLTSLGW